MTTQPIGQQGREVKSNATGSAVKLFTAKDVDNYDNHYPRIYLDRTQLVYAPLWWHKQGLSQTATGYGRKLTTDCKINYEGRLYRLYCTQLSNAGSVWFKTKGKIIYVS